MKSTTTTTTLFSLLALVPLVAAHGYVASVKIDGTKYDGPYVGEDGAYPIRPISTIDPMKGADYADLSCGTNSYAVSGDEDKVYAQAQPGSDIEVSWMGGGGHQAWPHNVGPMLTYLARCDDDDCMNFDSKDAEWFKIDEVAMKKDGSEWEQADLMQEEPAKVTLPSNLAAGSYLLRHEIIALHIASDEGGAEFYAGCVQMKVGGSETGAPSDSDLVKFPGAYSDEDPGILVNAFSLGKNDYQFPGPNVSDLSGSSSGSSSDNDEGDDDDNSSSASSSGAHSSKTSSGAPEATGGYDSGYTKNNSCSLKKRSSGNVKRSNMTGEDTASIEYAKAKRGHPRVYSRIMRGLDWRSVF